MSARMLACVVAVISLAGCNQAGTQTPQGTSSGPAANAAPNGNTPVPTDVRSQDQTVPDKSEAASTDPAKVEVSKGKGESTELTAGLKNQKLVSSFDVLLKALEADPKDVRTQMAYVNALQMIGFERMNDNEPEKGYQAFAASAAAARKLLATKPELPEGAGAGLANVFYNDACVSGRAKKSAEALAALNEAINWGFSEFTMLESDADLESVRKLPDYSSKLQAWKETAKQNILKHAREELAAGTSFPFDFALTDVDGKPIKLADFRGKVVIVDIWGTWCPPCRAEIPSFVQLQSTYAGKGFQMIGLNEESGEAEAATEKVKKFIEEQKMNYPCALVDESTKSQVPDFQGYPTTLFIDRTGKVRMKAVGLHEYIYLEAIVSLLLEEPAPPASTTAEK